MIYFDEASKYDTESCPGERLDEKSHSEKCLNCNKYWCDHHGWSCNKLGEVYRFKDLNFDKRYLTQSMKTSRTTYPIILCGAVVFLGYCVWNLIK